MSLAKGAERKPPRWLLLANHIVIWLNRMGLAIGTQHILSIPGRRTAKVHSTPVSLLTVGGHRYIVSGSEAEWVKNARAARYGMLSRGRRTERVALVEIPVEQRAPILREFPRQVRGGVRVLGLPDDPEAFAAASPHCPVFRLDS
jgi:hypothetical protein